MAKSYAGDPDIVARLETEKVTVFVDGVEYDKVLWVDEEEGVIAAYDTDENGDYVLDPSQSYATFREVRGKVEVKWEPR